MNKSITFRLLSWYRHQKQNILILNIWNHATNFDKNLVVKTCEWRSSPMLEVIHHRSR